MINKHTRYFDDGQLAMVVCILFTLVIFLLTIHAYGYQQAADVLNLPVMTPAFSDLHVIVSGYETTVSGGNPYISNETDPWNRLYNYPRAWMILAYSGLDHQNLFFLGLCMMFIFYFVAVKFLKGLTWYEGLYCGLLLVSPVSLLAIERGNVDVIIFIVLALAVKIYSGKRKISKMLTFLIVSIMSLLKLYPVFSIFIFLNERKYLFIKIVGLMFIILVFYFIYSWVDLLYIFRNTPDAPSRAYGATILPLHGLYKILGSHYDLRPYFRLTALALGNLILFVIVIYCIFKLKKSSNHMKNATESYFLPAFHLGAGIYLGSFAIGSNWEYRMIFIIFMIPQLFYWYRNVGELSEIVFITLGLIVILMQWNFFSYEGVMRVVIINELFSWWLTGMLIYLFLWSLPDWLKNIIGIRNKTVGD